MASDASFDGKSDWFYRNSSTGDVYRMLMDGTSITSAALAFQESNTAWRVVADGDFNGDGVADLLYRHDVTGQVSLVTLNASGIAVSAQPFFTEPDMAWKVIHAPDLNDDGRADILWWNSTTGQVYAMLMMGTTVIGEGTIFTEPDTNWRIVAVGDFAGAGKQNQLLWRNRATGQVWLTTVNYSGGVFTQSGIMVYTEPNLDWKIVAAADFTGDGKTDILYRNSTTGQIWMMFMNGSIILQQGPAHTEPNLAWKVIAVGDYNGNGKADLLWRNETTGEVHMMLMDGNIQVASQSVYLEPNLAWKLLGPWEYGHASGVLQ